MKKLTLLLVAFIAALSVQAQQAGKMPTSLATDPDIAAFIQLTERRYPRPDEGPRSHEQILERDKTAQEMHERVSKWLAKNPGRGAERAWLVLTFTSFLNSPDYFKEIKPGYDDRIHGDEMLVRDEVARARAFAERLEWLQQVRHDASVSAEARNAACFFRLKAIAPRMAKTKSSLDALSKEVEEMVAAGELDKTTQERVYATMFFSYSRHGAVALDGYLAMLSKLGSPTARQKASEEMERLRNQRTGLDWIKFTAIDGRRVDLSQMRGKVVLVDFGATWCVPCIAEIPGMVAAYAKYRDKGFEIVGLSLEDAHVSESDSEAVAAAKIAKQRKKLEDLISKHGITWPVLFETRGMENEFCARLGIMGIPAMFLVDQNGKVVSTGARGEALERELKTLLKL